MAHYVVVYASSEGQTRTVADRLAEALRGPLHEAEVVEHHLPRAATAIEEADAVVLAGSVHIGRIHRGLERFATQNAGTLAERPSALVVVCLTASKTGPEAEAAMQGYVDAFLTTTTWRPDVIEYVAGALRPAKLGLVQRWIIRMVTRQEGLELPPEGKEFTDWEALERFGRTLAGWFPRVGVATRAPRPGGRGS